MAGRATRVDPARARRARPQVLRPRRRHRARAVGQGTARAQRADRVLPARPVMEEARLEQRDEGLTAVTDGWFVLNVRDGPWVRNEVLGAAAIFEGEEAP